MRWASPSTMAVLPTPGSPMSTGLFLVRRDSTWMIAADLLVAPDDRVELALPGERGQVAAVLLQRLVGRLGRRARDPLAAADLLQRCVDPVARDAEPPQDLPGRARLRVVGERQQEVLGRDVVVLEPLGLRAARLRRRGGSGSRRRPGSGLSRGRSPPAPARGARATSRGWTPRRSRMAGTTPSSWATSA